MQFDVYPNPSPRMRDAYPYVVDLQSDVLGALPTRLVAPLSRSRLSAEQMPRRLSPVFEVKGERLMLVAFEAAPLDKRLLRKKVSSLKDGANELVAAMDAVLSGV